MKIEILIYCYGAVCLSMIIFNFLCIFAFKGRESRALRESRNFKKRIEKQLSLIQNGEALSEKEYKYLIKKLDSVGNLLAFETSIDASLREEPQATELYIKELHRVFLYLSSVYLKKEEMQSAYFLKFINKYKVSGFKKYDALIGVIMEYFKKPSVYCALNAMDSMYISGDSENVLRGLKILNHKDTYFHSKLIVKGLCSFEGDKAKLKTALTKEFDTFSIPFQVAIIDYFSAVGGCDEFVFDFLKDEKENDEIRYSAIRYFGRHYYEQAYGYLCRFAREKDIAVWIYTSLSVSALANYKSNQTIEILKSALSSANWYVRYNAAESLEKLGVTYNDLADVINGNDRYAREIITYQTEHKSLQERQVVLV